MYTIVSILAEETGKDAVCPFYTIATTPLKAFHIIRDQVEQFSPETADQLEMPDPKLLVKNLDYYEVKYGAEEIFLITKIKQIV